MKQKFKSYKFWVSLSAAIIIFLNALGKVFNFEIDEQVVDGVIMGFCGILVVLGFVTKDDDAENKEDETDTEKDDKKND